MRENVTVMERLTGVNVLETQTPGKKHNISRGEFRTETDGKTSGFCCESCNTFICKKSGQRVSNLRDLFSWLKQNSMID